MLPKILLPQGKTYFAIELLPTSALVRQLEEDFMQRDWGGRMNDFFNPMQYFVKTGVTHSPAMLQPIKTAVAINPENVLVAGDYRLDQRSARDAVIKTREAYGRIIARARAAADQENANGIYFRVKVVEQPNPVSTVAHTHIEPDVGLYRIILLETKKIQKAPTPP